MKIKLTDQIAQILLTTAKQDPTVASKLAKSYLKEIDPGAMAAYLQKLRTAGFVDVHVESRKSYGLEDLDSLDESSREVISKDVDWSVVSDDVRLYSARIIANKPAAS